LTFRPLRAIFGAPTPSSAMPADSPAQAAFLAALSKITGTGNFHSEGVAAFFLPEISVKGVGELAFPLPEAQVRELIAAAEVAPYGKGTETVRDDAELVKLV